MSTPYSRVPADSAEATRDLQDRIGRFARATLMIASAMLVATVALRVALGLRTMGEEVTQPFRIVHELALVLLFVVWKRCRGTTLSKRTLEWLDVGLTLALCGAWSLLGWGAGTAFPVGLSIVLATTHTLIWRAIVIPSRYERTLVVSAIAIVPAIFAVIEQEMPYLASETDERARIFLISTMLWCIVAVVVASLSSMTIYGLRRQIIEVGKLGQYTLAEKIGEGGMGVVYRAKHAMLRRPAAIKLLLPGRTDERDLARFEREVQLTSRLRHPNTVSIFDFGRTAEGIFYYVMEYLDGFDLERLVLAEGPIAPPRVIHILAQISGALSEAHALGLIHRDIKPANIVLTERVDEPDVVKVVDFGLVRTLDSPALDVAATDPAATNANAIIGTPMYLAPEAITAPDTVDARVDIYAVGAVAYFLLTGQQVFNGNNVLEVCSKHLYEAPDPPSERLGRPISADLEALVLSCLAKRVEDRPASAAALRSALLACADAHRHDEVAARAWWRQRAVELREKKDRILASDTTMAVDLRGRVLPRSA
jgi:serine/threonine-protein kinase